MERIVIIGCPGSGKSTLARALGEKLDLPVIHLDRLWWTKDQQLTSREEFDARLENALKLERWIIDGNYSRTMDTRLQHCDTIIYLDFSRWACLWGMFHRVILNRGKVRPDMAEGCPERFDREFLKFIWNFNKQNRVLNYTRIAKSKHAKAIVLKNRRELKAFLETL
jgi:adenylate kinase family enzyme